MADVKLKAHIIHDSQVVLSWLDQLSQGALTLSVAEAELVGRLAFEIRERRSDMALPNKAYYFVTDDSGAPMQLGNPSQDANGWFPNQETATAAATAASAQDPALVLHVVYGTRTVVANVTGTTQVTVTPV